MIRYALAFLGLSAGAADAQRLVPVASVLDMCGLHVEVLAADDLTNEDQVADECDAVSVEGGSEPVVPPVALSDAIVPTRAVVQRGFVPSDAPVAKIPAILVTRNGFELPDCRRGVMHSAMHPFDTDVTFIGTLDGANPSAMFCP